MQPSMSYKGVGIFFTYPELNQPPHCHISWHGRVVNIEVDQEAKQLEEWTENPEGLLSDLAVCVIDELKHFEAMGMVDENGYQNVIQVELKEG